MKRQTLLLASAALGVVVIVVTVLLLVVNSSEKPEPATSQATTVSPTRVETTTSAPSVPMTDFFGLLLPLDSDWEVLGTSDDPVTDRKTIVRKQGCTSRPKLYCSGFVVATMKSDDPKLPYRAAMPCNSDWIHDDLGWSRPGVVGTITVNGVEGEHFVQVNNCRFDEGNILLKQPGDTLHGWRFPSKGVVVYDSEGTDNFSAEPVAGVKELLQGARWK